MGDFKEFQMVLELKADMKCKKPRKSSKRSFLGCLNCKRKRIKCDETRGLCRNCVKSRLECVWPENSAKKKVKVSQNQGENIDLLREPNTDFLSRSPGFSPALNSLELQKMSFYLNQELSSSRENIAYLSNFDGFVGPSSKPSPSNKVPMDELFIDINNNLLIHQTPQNPPESDFFETLGRAFVQASSWIDALNSTKLDPVEFKYDGLQSGNFEKSLQAKRIMNPADYLNDFRFLEARTELDRHFLTVFIQSFLPTLAQVIFQDREKCLELVLAAAKESVLLQEVFIACGASIIAFNHAEYRSIAQERYTKAINYYLAELKRGVIQGGEVWFFVAVQVLQILCLRDMFADSNATRCAAHFGAAYKIISLRLSRDDDSISSPKPFLELEKIMMENFLFNYSITIFFCDHKELPELVPSPFVFFHLSRAKLVLIFYDSMDRYKYRSMLAFQIAAKCSWLCRLKLPLDPDGKLLHMELIQLAETLLLSFENESNAYGHANARVTMSIAKVVLNTSIILILKMVDFETLRAKSLQHLVKAIRADIDQPHNKNTIFPIWSFMIAASTSTETEDRMFFKKCLEDLLLRSKSKIIVQILNYLDGLWELYDGDEPFELMFDTKVLDQICN